MRRSAALTRSTSANAMRIAARPLVSSSRPALCTAAPSTTTLSRNIITLPHPALLAPGVTRFVIRTNPKGLNMLKLFAILRAVETRYGHITSVEMAKEPGTNRLRSTFYIELLRPVQFNQSMELEIAAPKHSVMSDDRGGPSLPDLVAILKSETHTPDITNVEGGDSPANGKLRFSIHERTSHTRRRARGARTTRTPREITEDSIITEALKELGSGSASGFDGLGDKYAGLFVDTPEHTADGRGTQETAAEEENVSEVDEIEEAAKARLAEHKARMAAARAARAAAVTPTPASLEAELAEEGQEAIVMSRAEKLRQKALDAARVNARLQAQAIEKAEEEAATKQEESEQAPTEEVSPEPEAAKPEVAKPEVASGTWRGLWGRK